MAKTAMKIKQQRPAKFSTRESIHAAEFVVVHTLT